RDQLFQLDVGRSFKWTPTAGTPAFTTVAALATATLVTTAIGTGTALASGSALASLTRRTILALLSPALRARLALRLLGLRLRRVGCRSRGGGSLLHLGFLGRYTLCCLDFVFHSQSLLSVVAHALVRAASRLFSTPVRRGPYAASGLNPFLIPPTTSPILAPRDRQAAT